MCDNQRRHHCVVLAGPNGKELTVAQWNAVQDSSSRAPKVWLKETDPEKQKQFGGKEISLTSKEATGLVNDQVPFTTKGQLREFVFADGVRDVSEEDYNRNIIRTKK